MRSVRSSFRDVGVVAETEFCLHGDQASNEGLSQCGNGLVFELQGAVTTQAPDTCREYATLVAFIYVWANSEEGVGYPRCLVRELDGNRRA